MAGDDAEKSGSGDASKIPKIDPTSPYFLGSQDNPGNTITNVVFRGDNYEEWSRSIRLSLRARRKFGFIDGSISKPTSQEKLEDWYCVQSMLVQWIMHTIEGSVKKTIPYFEEAKPLWDVLKERFSIGNGPRIQQLKRALAECRQSRTMTVVDYFGKLQTLWDELASYEPIPACSCGGCKCDIPKQLQKRSDEERFHQFLYGINEELYGTVRSSLLSQDHLPTLARGYQTMLQEERLRTSTREKSNRDDVMAFAVKSLGPARGTIRSDTRDKSDLVCSFCERTGHDVASCFAKNGFPDWWGDRPRWKGIGRGRGTGKGRGAAVHATTTGNNMGASSSGATSDPAAVLPGGISPAQWKQLLDMLGSASAKSSDDRLGEYSNLSWIIDTGASNHVTGNSNILTHVTKMLECPIGLPDGTKACASKYGRVSLGHGLELHNVLHAPQLNCNLISVSQLIDDLDCVLLFNKSMCIIQDQNLRTLIGVGDRRDGLYYFRAPTIQAMIFDGPTSMELWHKRLGHPSDKVVQSLSSSSKSFGTMNKPCDICHQAKQTRETFHVSDSRASKCFELIHCDLWDPYHTPSSCGAKYFLTIVDDFSRAVWVFLLIDKMEVYKMFLSFFAMIDRQFSAKVQVVRSDNGTEFNCLKDYFTTNGILFQTSCVGTPQQNGRVERKHRHILNVARALRFQGNLPIDFWGECILGAGYLINRTPSSLLAFKTPYEILFGQPPSYNNLRVFGSLCYAHNQKAKSDKFDSRSRRCVFVGYPHTKKGWKLYDLDTGDHFVSRDVKFYETVFPYVATTNELSDPTTIAIPTSASNADDDLANGISDSDSGVVLDDDNVVHGEHTENIEGVVDSTEETAEGSAEESAGGDNCTMGNCETGVSGSPESDDVRTDGQEPSGVSGSPKLDDARTDCQEPSSSAQDPANVTRMGRKMRTKIPSVKLRDFVTNTVRKLSPSTSQCSPASNHSSGMAYPIAHFVNCDRFSVGHKKFLAAVTTGFEPQTFKDAIKDPGWREAMQREIQALEDSGTWSMEILPPGKRALARLVVFGNHQVVGVDYTDTFAPVAKMVTVRAFLAVAAAKNWELHQMDVHNAFLHGDLSEEVYMKLPPGFEGVQPNQVCRLRKSLYGLKQAPRCWFAKLSDSLKRYGFRQSYSDYSLFTLQEGKVHINVLVYVDGLIISGNDSAALSSFKKYLSRCFHMKDLGVLKYFLGVEVARNADGIFLCQRKYTLDIITEAGYLALNQQAFQWSNLARSTSPLLTNVEQYRRLVGRLIYLSFTRPDLGYAPRRDHWHAALRVVRYLKGCPGQGILLRSDSDLHLSGWCDSDWASCPLTRRSVSGWVVFLGHSPISWKTKKQVIVSRSSAEAEYRSIASVTCELKWLKGLLDSLGVQHPRAISLYCDSQSALHLAKNPVFHERTKHIEVDCHFIRDAIQDGIITPSHVSTNCQLADIFTKALGKHQFDFLLSKLGICNPHAPT
ncbi:LOW QUALITY PROTEIN: hypothetical protein OSB04_021325 [Centaurea solstitialis]|uniref:Integrase catalytic domain-containing protein n=1 Tax=Centaurea solstitialis TaxID=347529 RepID=A0AA38W4T6_9ASTR|nr:LOW QUALITY PROTEIN: hypothetical protein OSB04_021325 [Centaurea solstitialis]